MRKRSFVIAILSILVGSPATHAVSPSGACQAAALTANLRSRTLQISSEWTRQLLALGLSPNATVVEIGPGNQPKIGLALRALNFKGTLFVIEPQVEAGQKIVSEYRTLMPEAKIHLITKALAEALADIPGHVDALLANHILDDMLVGEFVSGPDFQKFFANHYDLESSIEGTRLIWKRMTESPEKIRDLRDSVAGNYLRAVQALHPQHAVVFQYDSLFFKNNGFPVPDAEAQATRSEILRQAADIPQWNATVSGDWLTIRIPH